MEIYRQMYREAEPSADLDELIKSGETKNPNWFLKYYLPIKRQEEIIDFYCRKYNCNKHERDMISVEVYLGSAPNGYKKGEIIEG